MKVLVTGGCGFIGHHLVRAWAAHHPADTVAVLDALTYAADPARIAGLAHLVVGDVADPTAFDRAADALGGIDLVVHLAAESHVDRSLRDPARFVHTNVLGTQVLIDRSRAHGVARFLHVSTDEVYGSIAHGAVDESAPFRPGSPYAASKAGADHLVAAAVRSFGFPAVVARPANVFGTGQYPEKLLPVLARAAVRGAPLPLYGDGLHQRDWLAVEELCSALLCLAARAPEGSVWNLPGAGARTNLALAEAVLAAAAAPRALVAFVADRPGHDRRYAMTGEAAASLGIQARTPVEVAIPALVDEARRSLGGASGPS